MEFCFGCLLKINTILVNRMHLFLLDLGSGGIPLLTEAIENKAPSFANWAHSTLSLELIDQMK